MFNIPYTDMVTVQSWHNTIKVQPVCYSQYIQELILRIFDFSFAIYLCSGDLYAMNSNCVNISLSQKNVVSRPTLTVIESLQNDSDVKVNRE